MPVVLPGIAARFLAEALVRGDRFALIRARQTLEDLVRDEVDPDWL